MTTSEIPARAGRREWIGLAVLTLACLLYAMDLTVLHLAVPSLSGDLQPTSTELLWIVDIYGFLVAGALLTMGTLGDRIGRRKLLLIGAVAFSVISVAAAFSTTPTQLIASRALMGLAGATIAPATLSLIFNMFPDPGQRSKAVGLWITAFSAGGAVGPVIGGLLLERYWWGSVFLMALPVMALLLVLGPRVLPEYRDPEAGRLDLLSAGMSLAAVLSTVFGLKELAIEGFSWRAAATLTVGLVIGVGFWRRQHRLDDPLIDPTMFRSKVFNVALMTNLFGIFVAFGFFLFVAQYLQLVLGLSPQVAGLWSLPSALGFIVGANVSPRFIHKVPPALILAPALALCAVGLWIFTQAGTTGGLGLAVAGSLILTLALSPVFNLTTELIVGSAPPEKAGAASGISETGAELGGALGIAILGSLGVAVYRSSLDAAMPVGLSPQDQAGALDSLGGAFEISEQLPAPLGDALIEAGKVAFVDGLHATTAVTAVVALVVAAVVAALLNGVQARDRRPTSDEQPEFVTS
ncbi:MAG TPA: MFS transporter [Acidimicrobiia bacterium]|nr:MFS transporter [Acidimicrobiia bacterium]